MQQGNVAGAKGDRAAPGRTQSGTDGSGNLVSGNNATGESEGGEGRPGDVTVVNAGGVVGDVDFFLERSHACEAVCVADVVAYRISREAFTRMLEEAPQAVAARQLLLLQKSYMSVDQQRGTIEVLNSVRKSD